jgi:hypothetical protein
MHWSLGALDGAPDTLAVDGSRRADAFTITGGVQNPQGTSTSAEIRGIRRACSSPACRRTTRWR